MPRGWSPPLPMPVRMQSAYDHAADPDRSGEDSAGKESLRHFAPEIRRALEIRHFERKLLELYEMGQLNGTVHTCTGQEFAGIAVGRCLEDHDIVVSNHRGHGHFLGRGDEPDFRGLFCELLARTGGICAGYGGTQHLSDEGFISSGILGGMAPVAAGLAQQRKLDGAGLAVLFMGDGAMGEGVVYETLNLAALRRLPPYFVCEHNGMAQSTATAGTIAGDLLKRVQGFGLEVSSADTWNVEQLFETVAADFSAIRSGGGPRFLLLRTSRLNPHSKGDDSRDPQELAELWDMDRLHQLLRTGESWLTELEQKACAAIEAAAASALGESKIEAIPPQVTLRHDSSRRPARLSSKTVLERTNEALIQALKECEDVLIYGEDVEDPYGGAFKVTRGLSNAFPGRVFNMPISEAAIAGFGNGLAWAGKRPVAEIMFGDFLTLCMDQLLNHASKFCEMFGRDRSIPLVVRTPMGGGRGYGPTHSQSLEKHFLGIANLHVVAINHRIDLNRLYRTAILKGTRPTLIIENKSLYGMRGDASPLPCFDYSVTTDAFPVLVISPRESHPRCTLFCYGGTLPAAEEAARTLFYQNDVLVEIVAHSRLHPLDPSVLIESVSRTLALVTIEEGNGFAGLGAEVMAQLAQNGLGAVDFRRVDAPATVIPSALHLERAILPGADAVVQAVMDIL